MAVVVVESPAKAKTINKYLGSDYTVLASYGHVRDLPPKDGSVDPENQFEMKWEVATQSKKHVAAIAEALKGDDKDALEEKIKVLSEASAELAQKMYAEQAQAAGEAGEAAPDGDAVDAEFEEVKEDKEQKQ